jgi:urease accessory protein UreE
MIGFYEIRKTRLKKKTKKEEEAAFDLKNEPTMLEALLSFN